MKLKEAAAAGLGIATVVLGWMFVPLLDPRHIALYHWSGTATLLYYPAILDFLLLSLLATTLILVTSRSGFWRIVFWAALVAITPAAISKSLTLGNYLTIPHSTAITAGLFAPLCFLALCWAGLVRKVPTEAALGVVSTMFVLAGCAGLLFLGQSVWYATSARGLNQESQSATVAHSPLKGPRIIWVIFDELSYQQVFAKRFPGLRLGRFDSLVQQSSVFTNVFPAGTETQNVIPSLFLGKTLDAVRSNSRGFPSFHDQGTGKWQPFDVQQTVFQDATSFGYNASVSGWFNPYCRILAPVLRNCYWIYEASAPHASARDFVASLASPLSAESLTLPFGGFRGREARAERDRHETDLNAITLKANAALRDRDNTFTLIHLPVPHPPGIYDRSSHLPSTGQSTYIDNLALADACLGNIVDILKATGQWDSSVLLVMGDHSWRTKTLWAGSSFWSAEEDQASEGGQYDPRPAYIVKLAGQQIGNRIDDQFQAIRTRALLDGIMSGEIRTPEELTAWTQTGGQ